MLQKAEKEYRDLVKSKAIIERKNVPVRLKWLKATNDLALARFLQRVSLEKDFKDFLGLDERISFFDWVIVSSYYAMFHAAQSLLAAKRIKIAKRMHRATLVAFAKRYVNNNELTEELMFIYDDAEEKARKLLKILESEKTKRGDFQYHRLSGMNSEPAKESIKNAMVFLQACQEVLVRKKAI